MQITRRKFLHNTGIVIAGAALAGTIAGCAAEAGIPRHKALIVPPGPGVKPVKITDGRRYYDTNKNGIIDYCDQDGQVRMFNYLEDVLGNKFGFGWEIEQMARGLGVSGYRVNVAIPDAPESIWIGSFWQGNSNECKEYTDIIKGGKTPVTEEMEKMVMMEYITKRPHASLGPAWVAEYKGNEKSYYPFNDDPETIGHWPLTLKDLKDIKAKGPALIEHW